MATVIDVDEDTNTITFSDETPDGEDAEQHDAPEVITDASQLGPQLPSSPPGGYVADLLTAMQNAALDVRKAEAEVNEAKEVLKHTKSRFDACNVKLLGLVNQIDEAKQKDANDADRPLLDGLDDDPDDSWRAILIDDLDISDGIRESLREASITTVGELADFSQDGDPLTAIDGIGAAKAEKIEAAMEKFWAERKAEKPAA